jgi:hypothetical protein
VRGSKGSKVLRTRKVKQTEWNKNSFYKYFCSNGCYNDFANANIDRIVAIAPRTEPLETPIDDPTKIKHTTSWGHTYYDHTTKEKGVKHKIAPTYAGLTDMINKKSKEKKISIIKKKTTKLSSFVDDE